MAVLCDYDALPEIGHACGHNLIAKVWISAGIGVHAAFNANGKVLGNVSMHIFLKKNAYMIFVRLTFRHVELTLIKITVAFRQGTAIHIK